MTSAEPAQHSDPIDPRIRRTRQMLQSSLGRLLASKSLEQISVSDIAEAATLNRATFYDHYPDKFALLGDMVAAHFQDLLQQRGVVFNGRCSGALTAIALAVCDYLAETPRLACPERRHMERYMEPAMVSVVQDRIRAGLEQHDSRQDIAPQMLAAMLSGAIYSGAREWVHTPGRPPAEEAAAAITALLAPMLDPQTA